MQTHYGARLRLLNKADGRDCRMKNGNPQIDGSPPSVITVSGATFISEKFSHTGSYKMLFKDTSHLIPFIFALRMWVVLPTV